MLFTEALQIIIFSLVVGLPLAALFIFIIESIDRANKAKADRAINIRKNRAYLERQCLFVK